MSLNEIISLHGYGVYVWPAYGITLLVLGINLFSSLLEQRRIRKMMKENNGSPLSRG